MGNRTIKGVFSSKPPLWAGAPRPVGSSERALGAWGRMAVPRAQEAGCSPRLHEGLPPRGDAPSESAGQRLLSILSNTRVPHWRCLAYSQLCMHECENQSPRLSADELMPLNCGVGEDS